MFGTYGPKLNPQPTSSPSPQRPHCSDAAEHSWACALSLAAEDGWERSLLRRPPLLNADRTLIAVTYAQNQLSTEDSQDGPRATQQEGTQRYATGHHAEGLEKAVQSCPNSTLR